MELVVGITPRGTTLDVPTGEAGHVCLEMNIFPFLS
jgi:hypothetical protein